MAFNSRYQTTKSNGGGSNKSYEDFFNDYHNRPPRKPVSWNDYMNNQPKPKPQPQPQPQPKPKPSNNLYNDVSKRPGPSTPMYGINYPQQTPSSKPSGSNYHNDDIHAIYDNGKPYYPNRPSSGGSRPSSSTNSKPSYSGGGSASGGSSSSNSRPPSYSGNGSNRPSNSYTDLGDNIGINMGNSSYEAMFEDMMDEFGRQAEAARAAEEARLRQQIESGVNNLKAQLPGLEQQYQDGAQNAYIDYMQQRKSLPEQLSAQGMSGGASESSLAQLETAYGNSLNAQRRNRDNAIFDVNRDIENLRATGNLKLAENEGKYAQNMLNRNTQISDQMFNTFRNLADLKMRQDMQNQNNAADLYRQQMQNKAYMDRLDKEYEYDKRRQEDKQNASQADFTNSPVFKYAYGLLNNGLTSQEIIDNMEEKGYNENQIAEALRSLGFI